MATKNQYRAWEIREARRDYIFGFTFGGAMFFYGFLVGAVIAELT